MKPEIEKLQSLAYDILEANEGMLISGSLGLTILGVKIRRDPTDIDLYLPYGNVFTPIDGLKRYVYETQDDYENIYYTREAYKLDEIKIDIFTPVENIGEIKLSDEDCEEVLAAHVIIGFKAQHALGESYNRYKHKDDIMHILLNN